MKLRMKLRPEEIAERRDYLRRAKDYVEKAIAEKPDTTEWYMAMWNARACLNQCMRRTAREDVAFLGIFFGTIIGLLVVVAVGLKVLQYMGIL